MDDRKLMATGVLGTVVAVLCCLAPLLLTSLGVAGISAVLGDLEYLLISVAILLIGIPIYAVLKQRKRE